MFDPSTAILYDIPRMVRSLLNHRRPATSTWDIICWWENLRWVYNGIVGAAGLLVVLAYVLLTLVYSWKTHSVHLSYAVLQVAIPSVVYGIAANFFYTAGWISEIILHHYSEAKTDDFAKIAFVGGTVLSVLLTIVPGLFIVLFGAISVLFMWGY